MAEPCVPQAQQVELAGVTSPESSRSPILYPGSPATSSAHPWSEGPLPPSYRTDPELMAILQALPTKTDIESLVGRVEAAHRKGIQAMKQEVQSLSTRLAAGESSLSLFDGRLSALESSFSAQAESAVDLQLRMEEIEDRSRRNNLRLRGLPEATGHADHCD